MGILRSRWKASQPGADDAAQLAAIAADTIAEVYEHKVTYVPEDLAFVDQAVRDLAAAGHLEDKAQTLMTYGCLLGEILVRNDGATWRTLDDKLAETLGARLAVVLPNGKLANPIGAIFKNAFAPNERSAVAFRQQALELGAS